MARGRMVAKCLSTSQKYARLNTIAGKRAEFCQALYPLLVAHADDFGRQAGDVFTVKHAVVPTSPRKETDVEAALGYLHDVNLIIWYEAGGRKCIQIVEFDKHQPGLHKRTGSEFPGPSGNFPEIPSEGKGTEEKGIELNRTEGNAATPLASVPDDATGELTVKAVVTIWNDEIATTSKLPSCRGLSDQRRKHVHARLKQHGLAEVRTAMIKARDSPFCNGQNDRGWVLSFDWLMESEDHFLKVMEGKYDDRRTVGQADRRGRTGAPDKGKYAGIEERD